jgi:opacity protein-like surface antigen
MSRGLWSCIFCLAILLSPAANAGAETSGPYRDRDRDYRDRSSRGGFEGRTMLRFHGGISGPTGDFGDAVDTGWGLGGSIGYGIGRNTVLSWGIAYHRFGEDFGGDPDFDGHVGITPITMAVDYGFSSRGKVRPWISGGIGLYHLSEEIEEFVPPSTFITTSESENDFGFNFGFGIATPLSGSTTFGAGFKFHHIAGDEFPDTNFITLQAGVAFPL